MSLTYMLLTSQYHLVQSSGKPIILLPEMDEKTVFVLAIGRNNRFASWFATDVK